MDKTVYSNRIFDVKRTNVVIKGKKYDWEYLAGHTAVLILPMLDGKHVLVERQFRRAINKYIYELPAGRVEEGERPEKAAARELEEETGYKAGKLRLMFTAYTAPAWHTETVYHYVATGLRKTRPHREETEDITVKSMDFDQLIHEIGMNKIVDTKTIAAVLYYKTHFMKND